MPSFDIVSKVPWSEVDNALNQAQKELAQRYDFKDTETEVTKDAESLTVRSASEERAKAAWGVVQEKMIKRKVSLKFFDVGEPEATGKGGSRITIEVKEGITQEPAKKIVQAIKESKIKVQASIQDAQVRVSGKNKDDLQKAIQLVRGLDTGIEVSFINFRE
jgi:uncharacterized protein YajQ (UPF0234 family)